MNRSKEGAKRTSPLPLFDFSSVFASIQSYNELKAQSSDRSGEPDPFLHSCYIAASTNNINQQLRRGSIAGERNQLFILHSSTASRPKTPSLCPLKKIPLFAADIF